MNKSLFTKHELQDLRREFVKFKLADMASEDLFAYIRDVMMTDIIDLDEEELRDEIDDYDEYLYEVLAKYVNCLLYTSPSPRDRTRSRMPSSA